MQFLFIIYVLTLFIAALIGTLLAVYARQRWQMQAAKPFTFLLACVTWWGLFAALSAVAPTEETAVLLGVPFRFSGIILVSPAAILFGLAYTGRTEWLRPRRVGLILIIPLITLLLNWTAAFHNLFVYDVVYERVGGFWLRTAWTRGLWFQFVYNPYSYILMLLTLALLAVEARRSQFPYRQQAYLILLGSLIPSVASVLATFDLLPGPDLDLTVLGFLVMGLTFGWSLSRFHLLDIMPIARSTVIENMIDPMLILDNEDKVVELNPALSLRLGLSRRQAIGLKLEELFARWPDLVEKYQSVRDGQLVITVPANNRIFHFDVRISSILKDGRQIGRLVVWRDITRLKETDLALEASLHRTESLYRIAESLRGIAPLEKLFETVVDQVASTLPADRVTLIVFDTAAEQITHFVSGGIGADKVQRVSYEELMAGLSGWVLREAKPALSLKGQDDLRESAAVRQRRRETNAGSIIVVPILYRERILGTVTAIKRPEEPDFASDDLELLQAMANQAAVAIENTHLYEAQRERVQELKESNDALQAFSQMVAHDLKEPLTIMLGYAEIILDNNRVGIDVPEVDIRRYAELIFETSRKMTKIINDLLLLAQIRRQEDMPMVTVNMAGIMKDVLYRMNWQIEQTEARLTLPERWPEVVGNGPWVEEIWVNYLSNALKYGGENPVVELGFAEDGAGQVRFWVQDWGVGITAEEQQHLFVEFSRVGEREIQGHGLGLAIVRRIAERMGGTVGVESEVGVGSRFWFTLGRGGRIW